MPSETILVIDDAASIRDFLCQSILQPAGYQVVACKDGLSGLKQALAQPPGLILLDINLPGKTGLDVLKDLRQAGAEIPSIVMTSYGSEEAILQSFRLGAKDFLQKPFTAKEVLKAVADALAESRWQKERAQMTRDLAEANQKLQQQLKAWATLNGIGQTITSTLDEADVQKRLMWGINQLMQVEAGSLYLIDEPSGDLVLQISLGRHMEQKGGLRLKAGQGIAGWVAQHQRPALVPDVQADERFFNQVDQRTGFKTRSMLAVPLNAKGKLLGVIQVINPVGSKASFDLSDQQLLQALAAYVAVGVENARLYTKMRQTLTLETLKQTVVTLSHYINNSLTVLSLLSNILKTETTDGTLGQNSEQLLEMAGTIQEETERIARIISVLNQATTLRNVTYQGETLMLDIEPELRKISGEK
jgi:DNA-binding response OmpR family regulator